MSYNPNTAPSQWRNHSSFARAKAIPQSEQFDYVRVTRVALLLLLVLFWSSVIMAVF